MDISYFHSRGGICCLGYHRLIDVLKFCYPLDVLRFPFDDFFADIRRLYYSVDVVYFRLADIYRLLDVLVGFRLVDIYGLYYLLNGFPFAHIYRLCCPPDVLGFPFDGIYNLCYLLDDFPFAHTCRLC